MKSFILVVGLSLSFSGLAHSDQLVVQNLKPILSKRLFLGVIGLMRRTFSHLATKDGRELVIYSDYDSHWPQAFARRWDTDQILVHGGMAGLPGTTVDSFALTLCHELGHLYGGRPYGDSHNRISAEGQGDYWASNICFPHVLSSLPLRVPSKSSLKFCGGKEDCARSLDAALVMTAFFAENRRVSYPDPSTPDVSVVHEVLLTHPEPQCRLDTFWAGIQNLPRPQCWMPASL